jgi:hypothetical protein
VSDLLRVLPLAFLCAALERAVTCNPGNDASLPSHFFIGHAVGELTRLPTHRRFSNGNTARRLPSGVDEDERYHPVADGSDDGEGRDRGDRPPRLAGQRLPAGSPLPPTLAA